MSTTTDSYREVDIVAPEGLPTIEMTRDFAAERERVFQAWTDPDLIVQWLGPRGLTTRLDHFDARTGGSYRFVQSDDEGNEYRFYGAYHEVRPDERIVQTFTFEGFPDNVSLEYAIFERLDEGRTRLHSKAVYGSVEERDAILRSGMDDGVRESYERLDELLAD